MKKYLFMLFFVTLLTACHVHTDKGVVTSLSFKNETHHVIELFRMETRSVGNGESITPDATLAFGEQFKFSVGGWIGSGSSSGLFEVSMRNPLIVFDGRYQVRFNDQNLPLVQQKKRTENAKKGWVSYQYTITDADYEYAVENGELAILDEWGMVQ